MAYLRRKTRRKSGAVYDSWAIVESVRTSKGPRQRTVATIGKAPSLDEEERVGWEQIAEELSGRRPSGAGPQDFFAPPPPEPPQWAHVDLSRVRVERLRRFGDVYLALALWKRLRLDEFFTQHIESGREEVAWPKMAALHAIARLCEPSSDLAIAESFFAKTALDDLLGIDGEKLYDNRLYRALDAMLPHREALFTHLREVYGELFGARFDVLLYDITSTYFEGQAQHNAKAKRGYSRDSRPDCEQVAIGLVVTPEQLPLAYEVFDGNRADVTTLSQMFDLMEERYGHAQRTWVLDRGFVSEENLAELRRRGALYLVGTPRAALRKCERELLEKENWSQVAPGVEARLVTMPPGEDETGEHDPGAEELYLLCRSKARIDKDRAIVDKAAKRLREGLEKIKQQIDSGRLRNRDAAALRTGRLLAKYQRASRLYTILFDEPPDPQRPGNKRLTMTIGENENLMEWTALQNGCYLLRTNLAGKEPEELWRAYIGLSEAEAAFRALKSPLGMRPVYHHKTARVDAHILTCFLALCMRRTLSLWMRESGLGTAPDKLLAEMREIRSLDVVLMAREGSDAEREMRLRLVSTPEESTRALLHALRLRLPNRPKRFQNVVPTSTVQKAQLQQLQETWP
jgi:transposase